MRGLRATANKAGYRAASITAMAGLAAIGVLVAGCSTGGTGSRDEGAAHTGGGSSHAPVPASPTAPAGQNPDGGQNARRVDPIALLKADPKIGKQVKEDLKPCAGDAYPVDTSYGHLTNSGDPDIVVNVMTCGDAVGIGTYVYRRENDDSYTNVFIEETGAVYGTIDRGDLIVTRQVYAKGDSVAYPSGEDVITYRWSGNKFNQHDWVHNDYSKAVGEGGMEPAEPAPSPPPD
ncbi:hypothetical protein ABZ990_21365 [Streptomyces sp. NPDC046203]|uniref:hypothetical protein n=1 Tax=Streptomyces sp. NPDC046203 TaxID=3154602 RepID=UPI00340AA016